MQIQNIWFCILYDKQVCYGLVLQVEAWGPFTAPMENLISDQGPWGSALTPTARANMPWCTWPCCRQTGTSPGGLHQQSPQPAPLLPQSGLGVLVKLEAARVALLCQIIIAALPATTLLLEGPTASVGSRVVKSCSCRPTVTVTTLIRSKTW